MSRFFKGLVSIISESDHGNDNFALSVFFLKIPESFRSFAYWVTIIDNRYDLPGFKQFFNKSGGFSSPIPGASSRGITAKKKRQPPQKH